MAMSPDEDSEFTEFLRSKAADAERLIKYRPTLFLQMLTSSGGYQTAVQLLSSKNISEGFTKLYLGKHLELTVEALVLESQWRRHFDPLLQEIAAKRLRDAKYTPKPFSSPPTKSSPPAASVTVVIAWEQTIENIPIQLDGLEAGTKLQTLETWKDGTEPTTYNADCVAVRSGAAGWTIELKYDRNDGANKDIARSYPDVEWGILRLHVPQDLSSATARFVPDNGAPEGDGMCTLVKTDLYAHLTRAQVNVLLRPGQGSLREALLRTFGRCAVSNESTKEALEAAHIIEHSAGGSAATANAILLRADLHTLYDAGNLHIEADGTIKLVDVPEDSNYHRELGSSWNKRLPKEVLTVVRHALGQKGERAKPAKHRA